MSEAVEAATTRRAPRRGFLRLLAASAAGGALVELLAASGC